MILAFTAIIYTILCAFNVMKFEDEKETYLVVGAMFELMIFDSVLFFLWRYQLCHI